MSIRINWRKIAYLLVFFVFYTPPLFSSHATFSNFESILDFFRIAFFLLIVLYICVSREEIKEVLVWSVFISLFWLPQIIMSYYNYGNIMSAIYNYICMLSIGLVSISALQEKSLDYLKTLNFYFTLLVVINLIMQLAFPEGLLTSISMHGEISGIWLLGGENTMVSYVLPAVVLQCIRYGQTNKKIHVLLALICSVSVIISGSATGLVGILLFWLVFIPCFFFHSENLCKFFNINSYSIISLIVITLFVIIGNFSIFETIIVDFLKKDMTLTTRVRIWSEVLSSIKEAPIFGHGVLYISEFRDLFGVSHTHNYYLLIIYQGGIVAFTAFLLLFNRCRQKLSLYRNKKECYILSAGIFSFLVMFIAEVYGGTTILPFYILLILSFYLIKKETKNVFNHNALL